MGDNKNGKNKTENHKKNSKPGCLRKPFWRFVGKDKGFSMIEILVSVAIFSMIVGGITLLGVRTIQAHTRSRAMQNAMENARFAIETMNKRMRTSSGLKTFTTWMGIRSPQVYFVDNVTGTGVCYKVTGQRLVVIENSSESCTGTETELVGSTSAQGVAVSGGFFIKASGPNKRGFVMTSIKIQYPKDPDVDPNEKDSVMVQSGVSLRDY